MMRRMIMIAVITALAFAAALSCQRRPLYYLEGSGVKVIVKVIWKVEVYPDGIKPSGITLFFFRNGKYYLQQTTANVDSCTVQLEPGHYQLYMITQSPDEYGKMLFNNLGDFSDASVSVAETETKWYTRANEAETLIDNPELMSAGVAEEFDVTVDDVVNYQYYQKNAKQRLNVLRSNTKADGDVEDVEDDEELSELNEMINYYTIRVPVNPKSIVSQYWITIYSDNADVLRSIRASTSGMAREFLLTQDKTAADEGTQFITQWSLTMDDPVTRVCHLDGKITSFGFPNGELPSPMRDSTLNVAALLVDNKTINKYVFNVGNKITAEEPPPGYRSLYRLILGSVTEPVMHPDSIIFDTPSGFDATVVDWGKGDTVEILM